MRIKCHHSHFMDKETEHREIKLVSQGHLNCLLNLEFTLLAYPSVKWEDSHMSALSHLM